MFHNFVGYLTFLAAFLWVNKEDIKRLLQQTYTYIGDSPLFIYKTTSASEETIVSLVRSHFVCLASCMIWFPYVTSCSLAERREFLSIPKVVFPAQSYVGLLVFVPFSLFLLSLFFSQTQVNNIFTQTSDFKQCQELEAESLGPKTFPLFGGCMWSDKWIDFHGPD